MIAGLSEDEQLAAVNERATSYLWRAAAGSFVLSTRPSMKSMT